MIVVFFNNKLISADTLTPFLVELKSMSPKQHFRFYFFEARTLDVVVQNVVIGDALKSIGELRLFSTRHSSGFIRKAAALYTCLCLTLRVLTGNVTFIHFKALNSWPLNLLALLNWRRTLYFQPSASGCSVTEDKVDQVKRVRIRYNKRPMGRALIGFNKGWPVFADDRADNTERAVIAPPSLRPFWQDYLTARANDYLRDLGIPDDLPFGVFILPPMDENDVLFRRDEFPDLFEETLELLHEAIGDTPLVIKPHPATTDRYESIQKEVLARTPHLHLIVSNLHPMLLARRAKFFIANCFSLTFTNAHYTGVPTIEYTHYNADVLDVTGGGSMRPDLVTHFIDHDPEALKRVLGALAGRQTTSPATGERNDDAYDRVLRFAAGQTNSILDDETGGAPAQRVSAA